MRITFYFMVLISCFLWGNSTLAQSIPVEVMVGDQKSTLDIMFFSYFKNKDTSNSEFLFFNRNRASVDYKMTDTSYVPQFGFTEALSYTTSSLGGFAPVAVVQLVNTGIFPKIGIQYVKSTPNIVLFGWTVIEATKNPTLDVFVLSRYTPYLRDGMNLYAQVELLANIPTGIKNKYNFVQRMRMGVKLREFQFGIAGDFVENGRTTYTSSTNLGVFLRYEF
ncbi:MAG: hypothetical protein U0264_11000 [Candidatus Kapaibacterium sp.]